MTPPLSKSAPKVKVLHENNKNSNYYTDNSKLIN